MSACLHPSSPTSPRSPHPASRYEGYLSVSRSLYANQSLAGSRRSSSNCGTNAASLRDAQPNPTFGAPPPREAVAAPDRVSCGDAACSCARGGGGASSESGGRSARAGRASGGEAGCGAKSGATSVESARREPLARHETRARDAPPAAAACNPLPAYAPGVEPSHPRPAPAFTTSMLAGEGDILISRPLSAARLESAALAASAPQRASDSHSSLGANIAAILARDDFPSRAFSASRNRLHARPPLSAVPQRTGSHSGMLHTHTDGARRALHAGEVYPDPGPQRACGTATAEQPACRNSGARDPLLGSAPDGLPPRPTVARCLRVPGVVSVGSVGPFAASEPLQLTHDRQQAQLSQSKRSLDRLQIGSTVAPRHAQTQLASTLAVALMAQRALRKAGAARRGVDVQAMCGS